MAVRPIPEYGGGVDVERVPAVVRRSDGSVEDATIAVEWDEDRQLLVASGLVTLDAEPVVLRRGDSFTYWRTVTV